VWLPDGRLVNEILVREGWAMVLTIPPNVKYVDRFLRAQQEARAASRGLWAQSATFKQLPALARGASEASAGCW
jgi:endonuclease YncB( thermonuclease family)